MAAPFRVGQKEKLLSEEGETGEHLSEIEAKLLPLNKNDFEEDTKKNIILSSDISLEIKGNDFSKHKVIISYKIATAASDTIALEKDEEVCSKLLELKVFGDKFENRVALKFRLPGHLKGSFKCYTRRSEEEEWEVIQAEKGDSMFMEILDGYLFVYADHFSHFICTCKRSGKLMLDMVVYGKNLMQQPSGCNSHEIITAVQIFDRTYSEQLMDTFIESLKENSDVLFTRVIRDFMHSEEEVNESDALELRLELKSRDWCFMNRTDRSESKTVKIINIVECHTPQRERGTEAAEYFIKTSNGDVPVLRIGLKALLDKSQSWESSWKQFTEAASRKKRILWENTFEIEIRRGPVSSSWPEEKKEV